MKVLKLYAWEMSFRSVIERLRKEEVKILKASQLLKAYNVCLFWISPILVSSATFVSRLRIVQDPIRHAPDVIGMCIRAKVAFGRIAEFLVAPELECGKVRQKEYSEQHRHAIYISSGNLSWEENPSVPTLSSIDLEVKVGEKVAICGEVGAGKSTLLAAILGEIPEVEGTVQVYGKIAFVSQTAWIQ
ncbi:hypothetical protein MKX01_004953 [Papaver californicum]|nr:hypothetical protein MKX01_004953 [Papaver californicum]